jgi:two-component system chemotaxis response regulator CheY
MGLGRVLVVDDDAYLRRALHLILTKAGYDVVEAEEGEKGVAAIQKSDGDALLVDVIICDLYMPKMNGFEAVTYFRTHFPSVPVIVMTGTPDLLDAEKLTMQGVMDYLVKPVRPAELVAAVHKAALQKAVKGHLFLAT